MSLHKCLLLREIFFDLPDQIRSLGILLQDTMCFSFVASGIMLINYLTNHYFLYLFLLSECNLPKVRIVFHLSQYFSPDHSTIT